MIKVCCAVPEGGGLINTIKGVILPVVRLRDAFAMRACQELVDVHAYLPWVA